MEDKRYLCIDLKSFFASVECVERGLDPMKHNLIVADPERSEKTICLAVSPAMKALGVKNRCRVFEIPEGIEYITAPPRMKKYIEYAAKVYAVYLKFISKDDIYVYSIDEAFLDVTHYLKLYNKNALELAKMIIADILKETGLQSSCGIGTNLYLAKIALDITAKHSDDFIGYLDKELYRKTLWDHRPLTDFWRIGPGTQKKLESKHIFTMGDIANYYNKDAFYSWFGKDAELLIDHALGEEPTTIPDIKAYKQKTRSLTSGQVLSRDYGFEEGRIIVKEMMDLLCLDLVEENLMTSSITLHVNYSNEYRKTAAHGTASTAVPTNSDAILVPAISTLYERIVEREFPIRKVNITCNNVVDYEEFGQLTFFDGADSKKAHRVQEAVVEIKKKYGKNALLKGINLQDGATTIERNRQIGGHKSGE